jgi:hypothetical protein
MQQVHLTKPNGDSINLPPVAIAERRAPEAGEYPDGSQTVIVTTSGHKHGVNETLDQIAALIAALPSD